MNYQAVADALKNKHLKYYNRFDHKRIFRDQLILEGSRCLTERDKLQDAYVRDMCSIAPSVFLTLTMHQFIFIQGEDGITRCKYLDITTASSTLDVFCQLLSRKLHGRRCRQNKELVEFRGYFEGDPLSSISGREHLHFHGVMGNLPDQFSRRFTQEELFNLEAIIGPLWSKLDWGGEQIALDKIDAFTVDGCTATARISRYSTKKLNPTEPERYYAFGNYTRQ